MYALKPWMLAPVLAVSLALPSYANEEGRITVTGEATVHVVPDIASVSLGVATQAKTAAAALKSNNEALAAVVERLKAAGIEGRDLQTSNLTVDPIWTNYDSTAPREITGYAASNMLAVTVRDLDRLGEVLDRAVSDGANTLNGLTFGLSESAAAKDEARKLAVQDAVARARLLTDAAGTRLGSIVSIEERPAYQGPGPVFREASMKADASVPVERGEMGITSQVTLTWKLAD